MNTLFINGSLHYGIAGTLLWALALYRAWQLIPQLAPNFPPLNFYVPITIVWTLANMIYLAWYFIVRRDERAVQRQLDKFISS